MLAAGGGLSDTMSCRTCPLVDRREFLLTSATVMATLTPVSATQQDARYPVPAADGASIDMRRQVILVRDAGVVYAFALSCPHENTALRWKAREKRFQCPRHESRYTPDGTFTSGRATRNMDRFPITRAGNEVVVDLTKVYRSDADAAHWNTARITL
jgi:Rieske Fe-S protein